MGVGGIPGPQIRGTRGTRKWLEGIGNKLRMCGICGLPILNGGQWCSFRFGDQQTGTAN